MIRAKKYPCVKQMDSNDCGPACLATIMEYYGCKVSVSRIREIAKTDINGTTVLGIVNAARKFNFDAAAVSTKNLAAIKGKIPKPCIAHVVYEDGVRHYVVLYNVTGEKVIVADTGKGIIEYSIKEFCDIWTGKLIIMVPNNKFTVINKKNSFEIFYRIILSQRSVILKIFFISILITIIGILITFYYRTIIDGILPKKNYQKLQYVSIITVCFVILKSVIEFLRKYFIINMSKKIDKDLIMNVYSHVIRLPMDFFSSRSVGSIMTRINDGNKIRDAISTTVVSLILDIIMVVIGGIVLCFQNIKLFCLCLIPVIVYLGLVLLFKDKITKYTNEVMENNARVSSYLIESIEGIEVIKAHNAEMDSTNKFREKFNCFLESLFKNNFIICLQETFKGTTKSLFSVLTLWVGAYLCLSNKISIGTLVIFNALLVYFIEPIERLVNSQYKIQDAMIAANRLEEMLELDKEKSYSKDNNFSLEGNIIFENVNFRYGSRRLILENFSLEIKDREKVALVGPSGSGKTTIARLLMGFYEFEKGRIRINNNNLAECSIVHLRNKIAYISQESYFFSGTIKENLVVGDENILPEKIVAICKKVYIHDFIMKLPKGYDTYIAEKGSSLSGGQRQRLAIARALLKEPSILIMDEATSNLDTITEKAIEKTIEELTKNITTIIIAHRLSTVRGCDRIFVIDDGKIIETGTHDELILHQGFYSKMWNEQTD